MKLRNKFVNLFFLAIVVLNTQCKKNELDFNKYNNGIRPEVLTPLATTQVKAWEILKQSDIFSHYFAPPPLLMMEAAARAPAPLAPALAAPPPAAAPSSLALYCSAAASARMRRVSA